jgi:hypothetical protein
MLINSPHISGSLKVTGNSVMTGSLTVTGQVIAQTLNVQQVTSSIIYSSGSNVFGNSLANTQQFTGSMSVTGSLSVNNTPAVLGSGTTNYLAKFTTAGTVGRAIGIFESAMGNVGIGTISPDYLLDVANNFRFSNTAQGSLSGFYTCSNTGEITLNFGGTTTPNKGRIIYSDFSDAFSFSTNSTERMRITSDGNVGIGGSITSLSDSDDLSFFAGTTVVDNRARIELYGPTHATLANQTFIRGNQIVFTSNAASTERMRITSDGTLEFLGAATGLAGAYITNNNTNFKIHSTFGGETTKDLILQSGGSSGAPQLILKAGGNVLIGKSTDSGQRLQVNGIIHSNIGYSQDSGTVTINNNIFTNVYSISGSRGLYIFYASLPSGSGDALNYTTYAIISFDTLASRILTKTDGGLLFIGLSGNNITVQQQSGVPQNITYQLVKIV